MQIIIDMDGTICTEEKTYSRCLALPKEQAVESVNRLYDAGHTIIIYSARTWMEFEMTTAWLKKHGVKYHQLMMGKPIGDVWIDDRALRFEENWKEITDKLNIKK
ncbi:HAD hydrolase family protein [uncultured Bacteroides sp.]|uniref:LNS2 domain-containing protein n=1 Tax=uncultured Bacteroides sp. TaxID=162156 RepID=UPI002AA90D56|nr:HAD hydrolase family protein [uncultured Bacteroides sp.]